MRFRLSIPIRSTLAAAALALAVPFAFAASPTQDAAADTDATDTEAQATDTAQPQIAEQDAPMRKHQCLRSTGSLITASRNYRAQRDGKSQRCAPVFGRVYTSDDLQRTGYTDLGSALRALDTSIH